MALKKGTLNRKIVFFTTVLVASISAALIYLTLVPLNLNDKIPYVKREIEGNINGTVDLKSAKVYLFPRIRLQIEDFILKDENKEEIIKADRFDIDFSILPILNKELRVKRIFLPKANILFKRNKEGKTNFESLLKKSNKQVQIKPEYSINFFTLTHVTLKELNLTIKDKNLRSFEGIKNIKVSSKRKNNKPQFTINGLLGDDTKFKITLLKEKIDKVKTLTGNIEIFNFNLDFLNPFLAEIGETRSYGTTHVNATYQLPLDNFLRVGSVKGNLEYKDLRFEVPNAYYDDLTSQKGDSRFSFDFENKKDERKKEATEELFHFNITLEDAYLENIDHSISGSMKLRGNKNLQNLELKLLSKDMEVLKIHSYIPFKTISRKTKDIINFVEPRGGKVDIKNFELSMTMDRENRNYNMNTLIVDCDLNNSIVNIKDIRTPFNKLKGSFSLQKDSFFINKDIKGYFGNSPFTMTGKANSFENLELDFALKGNIHEGSVEHLIKRSNIESPRFKEPIAINASVKGNSHLLTIKSAMNFKNTDFIWADAINKKKNVDLALSTTIEITKKEISIKDLIISTGSSTLNLKGAISHPQGPYNFTLKGKKLSLKDIAKISTNFNFDKKTKGFINVDYKITKKRKDKHAKKNSEIKFSKLNFQSRNLIHRTEDLSALFILKNNKATMDLTSFKVNESNIMGKLDFTDIRNRLFDFNLVSPHLRIEDYFPALEKTNVPKPEKTGSFLDEFHGHGTVKIDHGSIFNVKFSQLDVSPDVDTDHAILPFFLKSNGGDISGTVVHYRNPEHALLMDSDVNINNLEALPFMHQLGFKDEYIDGKFDLNFRIISIRDSSDFISSLNGGFTFDSNKGKLLKFTTLSKMLTVVNVLAVNNLFKKGLPYKEVSGEFFLEGGILESDNLLLDSSSMRMSAIGKINLNNLNIDITVGMHPFATIDKIISMIPIAGWIIQGKDKSLVGIYLKLKGDIKDPKITPVTMKNLGKGFIGIFKRLLLIETPMDDKRR